MQKWLDLKQTANFVVQLMTKSEMMQIVTLLVRKMKYPMATQKIQKM
jgi:hypothetical protein